MNEGNDVGNSDFSLSFIIVCTNLFKACVYDRPEISKVFDSMSVRSFTERMLNICPACKVGCMTLLFSV